MPVDRVLIDTNVLISGAIYGGSPFVLLELGRTGAVKLLIPDCVVAEAREVLARKFPQRPRSAGALIISPN